MEAAVILELPNEGIALPPAEAVGVGVGREIVVLEAVESVEVDAAVLGKADQDVFEVLVH